MEKGKYDGMIAEAAKTIFLYCRARTGSREEAEDLTQDILFELLKSQASLRDEKAFYGFMWAVAGNVYKNWRKKRLRPVAAELNDTVPDAGESLIDSLEKDADIGLLYRELCLLTKRHRDVTILYYFDGLKISEISKSLRLSESMVKFLLFKARQILREGMNMERTRGELSFNPGNMHYMVWGGDQLDQSKFDAFRGFNDSLIAQNILLACYNDRCTAEEISVRLGVAVPYLEKDLTELCEQKVLTQKGGRYETSIIIFTKAFSLEAADKTLRLQREMAKLIDTFLNEKMPAVKAVGFRWNGENENLLKWHIAAIIFREGVLKKYQDGLDLIYPVKYGGIRAFVCGMESWPGAPGGMADMEYCNDDGDYLYFFEFPEYCSNANGMFFNSLRRVIIALDIARGKTGNFNENDKLEIAEFIKNGFVTKAGDSLSLNIPVFTDSQYAEISSLMDGVTDAAAEKTREIINITTEVLIQHTPVHLRNEAENYAWFKIFEYAMTSPVKMMLDNGILHRAADNSYPTAHAVLK